MPVTFFEILQHLRRDPGRADIRYTFGDEEMNRIADAAETARLTGGADAALDVLEAELQPYREAV
jgi:hypothetical protein